MSRSYRKPYVYMTKGIRESHASDKRIASKSFRRMADLMIRMCEDWDELLTPHKFEARHNNVYSWAGDGHAIYEGNRWGNLDNVFYGQRHNLDECFERYKERLARFKKWDAKIRRK